MKVVLIDDEQLANDVFEMLLQEIDGIEIVGMYTDAKFALTDLERLDVDVVFLDMEMGDVHGLAYAEELMLKFPKIEVVFVTAHPQYALEAFEVNAMDYLLKPVKLTRLQKTIRKLNEKRQLFEQQKKMNETEGFHLFARTMGSFHLLDSDNREVKWRTRKVKELFVYLWYHREKATHRSRIMEELWSDLPDEKAATLMHTTIYQLRKGIKEMGIENPISLVNEKYMLTLDIKSDYGELEQTLQSLEMSRATIEKLIELYQGDFLEEEDYHWAISIQEKMRRSFLQYLEQFLSNLEADKRQSYYIEICLQKMIEMDPYNENYMVMLLSHYGKMQRTDKLVHSFHEFKQRWIEELGLDIPKAVLDLYTHYIQS